MTQRYLTVANRAEHRCEYCRAPEVVFNLPFEVEHIIPVTRGGSSEEDNLALACRGCNLFKADHVSFSDDGGHESRLFHPRHDSWDEHFRVSSQSGEIIGLTPIGVGTIARLQMNRALSLAARKLWVRIGLFP